MRIIRCGQLCNLFSDGNKIEHYCTLFEVRSQKKEKPYTNLYGTSKKIGDLDDATVQPLLDVCKGNTVIFRRYFKEKARMLGVKKFTYRKSIDIVLKTFEDFDSQFRDFAERVFIERHIDSQIRNNKQGGAFCSSVTPKISPYVLLNFGGKLIDVSTMAHEFGHSIHSLAGCVSLCRNAAK